MFLEDGEGVMLLIDLAAAFPSISQEYLFKVLERQNILVDFRRGIQKLYTNNTQFIKLDGDISESFTVKSRVRQGCPLSPVLFALIMDPFLDYLLRQLPQQTMLRAFADDMALVLKTSGSYHTRKKRLMY